MHKSTSDRGAFLLCQVLLRTLFKNLVHTSTRTILDYFEYSVFWGGEHIVTPPTCRVLEGRSDTTEGTSKDSGELTNLLYIRILKKWLLRLRLRDVALYVLSKREIYLLSQT